MTASAASPSARWQAVPRASRTCCASAAWTRPAGRHLAAQRHSRRVVAVGLRLAGVAETALSAGYTEAERRHALTLSGARLVLTTRSKAASFRDLGCEAIAIEDIPEAPGDLATLPPVPGEAWARIGFTSGTTGAPKAIITTHAARFIGNLLQRASFSTMPGPGSRILLMTPFIHGAGLLAHAFHDRGAAFVLLDGVDIPCVTRLLDAGEIDHIFAPPTVLAKLVSAFEGRHFPRHPHRVLRHRPAHARAVRESAGHVRAGDSRDLRQVRDQQPDRALSPAECDDYYTQEPSRTACASAFPAPASKSRPGMTTARGALRAKSEKCICADGTCRSVTPTRTDSDPLPPDGFHATGDLGRLDARGRLHLVGRMADVIKSGGYKIHPDEIEQALAGSAGPAAVAIVSLPSEYWGEVIVAVAETSDATWPVRAPPRSARCRATSTRAPSSRARNCRATRRARSCAG